jgi:hypothetical protein
MMIKIADEYLDFNGSVPVRRKYKTFDNISQTQGDMSYDIEINNTAHNRRLLGISTVNTTLTNNVSATVYNDSGNFVYSGYLRIENRAGRFIHCTLYSGNSEWMQILNVPLRNSFAWSAYDIDLTEANIAASWNDDSGIVWPLVDRGVMATRKSNAMWNEDFQPFIHVKDVMKVILNQSGVKMTGELVNDPVYNTLITTNNGLSGIQKRIEDRTVWAGKSSSQTLNTTFAKITFTDVATPYENSLNANWSTVNSRYTADADYIKLAVEVNIKFTALSGTKAGVILRIVKNGGGSPVVLKEKSYLATQITETFYVNGIASGDTIEIQMRETITVFFLGDVDSDSWVKITPVKFYKVFADALLPNLKAGEFVSQIFKLFNVVASWDPFTKTIKTTKFTSIKNKTPIDISEYLNQVLGVDYTEFLSDFGQRNLLVYKEQSSEEVTDYNGSNAIPYGGGELTTDDTSLDETKDLVSLEFIAPYQRLLPFFGTSLPYLAMVEANEGEQLAFTSVTDNGDSYARFNFSGSSIFSNGDTIRVSGSSIENYNGDYRIISNNAAYLLLDCLYEGDATGDLIILSLDDVNNEDQIVLINIKDQNIEDISGQDEIHVETTDYTAFAFAYFYLPQMNLPINTLKRALYFDPVNDPSAYQAGLSDGYRDIERITNDPVKVRATFNLPLTVFLNMEEVVPLRLQTEEFNCLFYANIITGYQESSRACEVELIKL